MRNLIVILMTVFAFAAVGCETTEDANKKIDQCLEDEYGDALTEDISAGWELDCDDSEDDCKKCVNCIMDEDCGDLVDGSCSEKCDSLLQSKLTETTGVLQDLPIFHFSAKVAH